MRRHRPQNPPFLATEHGLVRFMCAVFLGVAVSCSLAAGTVFAAPGDSAQANTSEKSLVPSAEAAETSGDAEKPTSESAPPEVQQEPDAEKNPGAGQEPGEEQGPDTTQVPATEETPAIARGLTPS